MMGKMNMTPKEFLEKMYGVKLEEPNLSPEHLEQTRQRLEELATRPVTEERIQKLSQDGQEDI